MIVRPSRFIHLGLSAVLLMAFAGGGCGSKEPARTPVVKKAVPKGAVKAAVQRSAPAPGVQRTTASYDPTGKRDPFVPFIKVAKAKKVLPSLETLPPLQRYELGELRFVGVIWGPHTARALVEDGAGKGYTVTVGTKIGRNGGVVSRITENEIVVREQFRDYTGAKVARVSSLKLHTGGEQ